MSESGVDIEAALKAFRAKMAELRKRQTDVLDAFARRLADEKIKEIHAEIASHASKSTTKR